MIETGIPGSVIEEIQSIAQQNNLDKVILFGSRAKGTYRRASDIDLAVSGGNVTMFALDVDEETSTPLKYDVVDLNQKLQAAFRQSIEKEGIILYEKI